tara:strand:- start:5104 stop:6537 length:1434 start_codon:yes stop_codon:yes gene_type:complete
MTPVETIHQLPYGFAKQYSLVFDGVNLFQTASTPLHALVEAQRVLQPFNLVAVTEEELSKQLQLRYQSGADNALDIVSSLGHGDVLLPLADALPQAEELLDSEDNAPIIRLINAIIAEAIREQASDIHIEPNETCVRVRLRKDGVLQTVIEPKRELAPLLSSRIKIMSKLDIAERRLPQDGRMGIQYAGRPVDIRVSIIPSGLGERIVLRLLDRQSGRLNLAFLGMPKAIHEAVNKLIQRPHGIILVTGPTGSGKTTTLYAALQQINQDSRNIMTIEDPVEYDLNGISQTAVNTQTGMTFAQGLRSILRQDPNVIMVGEIRDLETAKVAVQASLTGHLVFSTVHTNTAVGTITRLQDMGVEPFLLSSGIIGVLAQRLVRRLCSQCKQPDPLSTVRNKTWHAVGCSHCQHTGYKGRVGVYELLEVTEELKKLIHDGRGEQQLQQQARQQHESLHQHGLQLVAKGITSSDEILRVSQDN